MPIETKDILVADSTIIAGVLILLSITVTTDNPLSRAISTAGLAIISMVAVVIFSASAMFALHEDINRARQIIAVGFLWLIVLFALVALNLSFK